MPEDFDTFEDRDAWIENFGEQAQSMWYSHRLEVLTREEQWEEAWMALQKIPDDMPTSADFLHAYLSLFMQAKQWEISGNICHRLLLLNNTEPADWFTLAMTEALLGNLKGSSFAIDGCLAADPTWRARIYHEPIFFEVTKCAYRQQISLWPHIEKAIEAARFHIDDLHTAILFVNSPGATIPSDQSRPLFPFVLLMTGGGLAQYGYAIASEPNRYPELGGGSHFLCVWSGDSHTNHGDSNDWADEQKFVHAALAIAQSDFSHQGKCL